MKTYMGKEVEFHAFLTPVLVAGEWSASRLDIFTPRQGAPTPTAQEAE
jgi:hypothetical protein